MKINTQCSLAIHIMLLLAAFSGGDKLTSEKIAQSTGNNPVIIRNILGSLKRAGLVNVRRGSGGAELARPPEEITLWHIYRAVDPTSLEKLIGIHPNPSQECPIGSRINGILEGPYSAIRSAVQSTMAEYTLGDLVRQYQASMDAPQG